MNAPFVPVDFVVPESFVGPGFRLEPLAAAHNERDHAAWMSSIEHILATPGSETWGGSWPVPMTLEENLSDLNRHAKEFAERVAFAYSILDGDDVVGCLYIKPTDMDDHDVEVKSWVRASRAELDRVVWEAVSDWLATVWPFLNPCYAPRP
ncbi:MAG: N-acetyltransferase [Acidimicrobiia bacterium]|nr:N-acetyltransferase [Acidimicrobiia bacterium]